MNFYKQISFLFSLILTACLIHASTGEIVSLNDATFEHQTQASTGMTTGSWLVFFKATRCPHCNKLMPEYVKLSEDEEVVEKGIVLSTVDVNNSPRVSNRFMIRGFPTVLFLHKKRLYMYRGKRDYESLKDFVLREFEFTDDQEIPPPPSAISYWLKMFKVIGLELKDAAMGKAGMVGYAIILLVGMVASIFIFIISMFFMPAKKVKEH
mmetsp:Transcript_2006/g.2728  ORF Transcript_2006/g.2728 Transcript_2006/m.2728 type:complete len:209 (-) Transcript_2006:281-907(-)